MNTWDLGADHSDSHQNVHNSQGIRPNQHEFVKDRSLLISLVSFCDKITHFVDEGKAVHSVCLHLSKASDTFSHGFLLEKLAADSWLRQMLWPLDKNTLPVWLQRVGGMELHPAHGWSLLMFPKAQHWCQSYLIPISMIWMRKLSLQTAVDWVGMLTWLSIITWDEGALRWVLVKRVVKKEKPASHCAGEA